MKIRVFIAFLTVLNCIACKEEKKEKIQNPEPPKVIPTVTPAELHGSWVKADYIEDLAKTLSPRLSFKKLEGIALFSFDTAQLKGTILTGGISYNGHEGSACTVEFQSGKTPRSILVKNIEGDTAKTPRELVLENNELFLMSYPNNGSAIGERYISANKKNPNIDSALSYAVRRNLFAGKWQWKDIKKDSTHLVELSENGVIHKDSTFVKYDVSTDFMVDELPYDQIFLFDSRRKRSRTFQYKFNGDTLQLSERSKKKEILSHLLIRQKK